MFSSTKASHTKLSKAVQTQNFLKTIRIKETRMTTSISSKAHKKQTILLNRKKVEQGYRKIEGSKRFLLPHGAQTYGQSL